MRFSSMCNYFREEPEKDACLAASKRPAGHTSTAAVSLMETSAVIEPPQGIVRPPAEFLDDDFGAYDDSLIRTALESPKRKTRYLGTFPKHNNHTTLRPFDRQMYMGEICCSVSVLPLSFSSATLRPILKHFYLLVAAAKSNLMRRMTCVEMIVFL